MVQDVSRRDFLKVGGIAGFAAGAAGLGIGSILGAPCRGARGGHHGDGLRVHLPAVRSEDDRLRCAGQALRRTALGRSRARVAPSLSINGSEVKVQVEPHWTLRETLLMAVGLTGGAKQMCDRGACGSCTVLIDGVPALSCSTLVVECQGKQIETSEGIAADEDVAPAGGSLRQA